MAAHDAEPFLRPALESALRQTEPDLELVVVDDGSTDATPAILERIRDPRLVVLRNEETQGLAASLNRALDIARGRYVARLDADDVAFEHRLARQVERLRTRPRVAVVGSAALEVDEAGRPGALHVMPSGPNVVRWAVLFSSPFFHPSVLVERAALERHGLRYDSEYLESEDYDLWARLLAHESGDNLLEPLVLYRTHPGQASQRRRRLQREFQRRVALREIARVAPGLASEHAELAWRVGAGEAVEADRLEDATAAFAEVLAAFEGGVHPGARSAAGREVRARAARALARAAIASGGSGRARALAAAARIDPTLPLRVAAGRLRRRASARAARSEARRWLKELEATAESTPIRVAAVFPEPTPYRAPLLDRIAARPDVDLTVIYAAETVAGRTWAVEPRHPAVYLRGVGLPGAGRLLRHEYPITPGVARALSDAQPDVVVVSGWSTFAAQAAIVWCRARRIPYLLVVESHDEDPRPGWRRAVKGTVVPMVVRRSAGVLVAGALSRRSMVSRGAAPERVRIFANTIDVEGFGERADRLAARRGELREGLGAAAGDVVVLSVARLAPEKGHDVLVRGIAEAGDARLLLVLAGAGSEQRRLEQLAGELGVRLVLAGDVEWQRLPEVYVAADVFALLSEAEPWGVVVNEAAACGLPLVLSDRVGAAHDLLRDRENGVLVAAGDVAAAAEALGRLADDEDLRRAYGARSREIVADWGYGPSVDGFVTAVRDALSDGRQR